MRAGDSEAGMEVESHTPARVVSDLGADEVGQEEEQQQEQQQQQQEQEEQGAAPAAAAAAGEPRAEREPREADALVRRGPPPPPPPEQVEAARLRRAEVERRRAAVARRRRRDRERAARWWTVKNRKEALGALMMAAALLMLVTGLSTRAWVVGTVTTLAGSSSSGAADDVYTVEWTVGLLRTRTVYTPPEGQGEPETRNFKNEGDELQAGETALALTVPAAISALLCFYASVALAYGRHKDTEVMMHAMTIWGSFLSGLLTIVGAIAYSAEIPKLVDPLTFGYSFILVLCSGFLQLIAGLLFVLARQEQAHLDVRRPVVAL